MPTLLPITEVTRPSGELCVARVPLFQGLNHEQQLGVASVAQPTHLERGERVYSAGSDISQLMVVHTGRVKISRLSADGHEQIIRVLGTGDFIGESAFLTGARPDHEATALETARLCVFRHADLSRLVEQHPSVGLRMLQAISQRLGETEARLAAVISGDVSSRIADYLLTLPAQPADPVQPGALQIVLPLAKKDIASLLDTTPETLSRVLRRLSDSGAIEMGQRDRITLTDLDALTALAGGA